MKSYDSWITSNNTSVIFKTREPDDRIKKSWQYQKLLTGEISIGLVNDNDLWSTAPEPSILTEYLV